MQMSEALDIPQDKISRIETGRNDIDLPSLREIARFFNTTTDYLLCMTDVVTPDVNTNMVCSYTGLSEEAVEALRSKKEDSFYNMTLEYLAKEERLLDKLSKYLFSGLYDRINRSDYRKHLEFKEDQRFLIQNPELAEKLQYSDLLDWLPVLRSEFNKMIEGHKKRERWMLDFACRAVDEDWLSRVSGEDDDILQSDDEHGGICVDADDIPDEHEPTEEDKQQWDFIDWFHDAYKQKISAQGGEDKTAE